MSAAVDTTTRGLLTPGDHKHRCPKCHESKFCRHACTYCEDQSEGEAVPHGYYAECEDCARPCTTTRSIPYAGVSNPMPRTTAEERALYEEWEQDLRDDLDAIEDEYVVHAQRERAWWRDWRSHEGRVSFVQDFAAYWRSLPGYSGPPRRAPSGVRWARDAITGLLADEPMCVACPPTNWSRHIKGLEPRTKPDDGRVDEHGIVRYASWYMENFGGTRMITDCFDSPGVGGRGWCPGLAGVGK